MPRNDPTLASTVCVALVAEGPTHGWAVAALLAPGGPIGRIWSLSRPLTYRTLDLAATAGLVERIGSQPGGGRSRTLLAVTDAGRRRTDEWLASTIDLPRDVRTELLVKFVLRERAGLANAPLARAQRSAFEPMLSAAELADSDDIVDRWRREHLIAIDRFLASFEGTTP